MNVFDTHEKIVGDYSSYIKSFINISDESIRHTVDAELSRGKLWPDPLLNSIPRLSKPVRSKNSLKVGAFTAMQQEFFADTPYIGISSKR